MRTSTLRATLSPRTAILCTLSASLFLSPFAAAHQTAETASQETTKAATQTFPRTVPLKTKDGKEIPLGATKSEIEMGNKATERLEKHPKVKILDPNKDEKSKALYAKLNDMAQRIGKVSARPQIDYKVKVIEDDQINAFTLPNGNVYFFTGLLDVLSSDDEIAAVMAHEIGHNSCMHVIRGDKKAKNLSLIGLAALAAALLGGAEGANIAAFSQYALIGVMNGYSLDYEKEADTSGVADMIAAGYNPSAMATVMQRFENEEKRRPKVEMGIYETHPGGAERVEMIAQQIRDAGLPFTPRAVTGAPQVEAVDGKERVQVKYKDIVLMEFAANGENSPALKRAQNVAKTLNELMRDNLQMHQIKVFETNVGGAPAAELSAQGVPIARVLPADAKMYNLPPLDVAKKWRDSMRLIFWRETVHGAL